MDKDEALKLALEAHQAMREWIDAVPDDTVLPTMPGCDRDWLDEVEANLKKALAAQSAQEPVAWAVYDKRGGSKSLHWPEQHSPDGDANMFNAVPLVPQRP